MMSQKRGPTPSKVPLKAPTPLRTTMPSAPYDAMVNSQQAHIDDLVQKNRTLEHTIKKLKDELSLEEARAKDAIQVVQTKWKDERKEWREGCETLQACHRIAHLRTSAALDEERIIVLKERGVLREERLARLQRDYKITMFQAREADLESQVLELEDELEARRADEEYEVRVLNEQHQKAMTDLQKKYTIVATEVKDMAAELTAARKDKEDAEDRLRHLREEHADSASKSASSSSKLERITLQRDTLLTRVDELKQANDDLKRSNSELQRQVDKWQSLENRGEAELDNVRKQKIDLEIRTKDIERKVGDAEEKLQGQVAAFEKERRKVDKLRETLEAWKKEAEDQQAAAEVNEKHVEDTHKQLAKANKQVERLESQLEAIRSNPKPSSSKASPVQRYASVDRIPSEDEVEKEVIRSSASSNETGTKQRSKRKPSPPSRRKHVSPALEEIQKPESRGRAAREADSDVEIIEPSTKSKNKQPVSSVETEDTAAKRKRGRPKKVAAEDDQEDKTNKQRGKKATPEVGRGDPPEKGKSKRITSGGVKALPTVQEEDDSAKEEDSVPKKKKRKINIFPAAQPPAFSWNQMAQGDSGLNIPTELSPVKDTDTVPRRFGRVSAGSSFSRPR
ncbi:hypothetical protein SERLA73DRAFT_182173 [Serpula lacrymans var. lacrymans S7.3]|uniref:Uncharacterized protein n=1 Tax=Serpula lacrymans var. lacrymans (strain S7.3) TaxID=936435 RepID=F8PWT4_SERL3|nr:hypothetical protein SERLA73DRAFT_182173 [Serpula lacrymans var. lacrymans S7.3]